MRLSSRQVLSFLLYLIKTRFPARLNWSMLNLFEMDILKAFQILIQSIKVKMNSYFFVKRSHFKRMINKQAKIIVCNFICVIFGLIVEMLM